MASNRGDSPVLGQRALNRATLARQHLLERSDLGAEDMVVHLVGLQAQTTKSWYAGLWSRLNGFDPMVVGEALTRRRMVRAPVMRTTIHLLTAADCLALRPLLDVVLSRTYHGQGFRRRLGGADLDAILAEASRLIEERPRTRAELGPLLAPKWPDADPFAMAMAPTLLLPVVQVPPRGVWGASGPAAFAGVETWLGRELDADPSVEDLVRRYLAAFGPASVKDVQTWCGLTRLAGVLDRLRPELLTFRDEKGVELFDLPDAPRPPEDTPAPVRFLYEFDNLLLSHADRSRVLGDGVDVRIAEQMRPLPGTVLLDGIVGGLWNTHTSTQAATMTVTAFRPLGRVARAEVEAEGEALLRFLAPGRDRYDVEVGQPA